MPFCINFELRAHLCFMRIGQCQHDERPFYYNELISIQAWKSNQFNYKTALNTEKPSATLDQ